MNTIVRFLLSVAVMVLAFASDAHAQAQVATTRSGCGVGGAFEGLLSFGPQNQFGYPSYYVDQAGLAMDHCNSTQAVDPFCVNPDFGQLEGLPLGPVPDVAAGNFWTEGFYFRGLSNMPTPIGQALLVLAVENVWDNATEAIIDGDQLVFSRIRVRVDIPNLPSNVGTYTVTHPYGVDTFNVTAADLAAINGTRAINFTDDCLHQIVGGVITPTCGVAIGDQFTNPLDPARSRISNFLKWDPLSPPAAPLGHVGSILGLNKVVDSPCATNFFKVEGPAFPGGIMTDQFAILGRRRPICGNGFLDVTEQCDDGNTLDGDCCSSTCTFEAAASACTHPCQVGATCDGAGVCGGGTPTLVSGPCTDNDVCTFRDTCAAGQCVAGGPAPCPTGTVEADAVIAQASPNSKFGTTSTLDIDGSPVRQALFRVSVSGLTGQTIQSAKLRLTVGSTTASSSNSGGRIHIAPCTWNETTVTWNTRPQPTFNPATLATLGTVARNEIVNFDVTSAIPGNGTYCFAIDTTSADNVIYRSREASAALRPQLVLTTACASCTPPVCGDNLVNRTAEACDGADDTACPGRCRANCTCGPPPVCGDGIVNQVSEQCDGASAIACPGQCRADCTCPAPPVCGDNIVNQVSEQCDGTSDAACPGGCQVTCTCTPGTEVPVATVVADTYVAAATPTTNFGAAAAMGADGSPVEQAFVRITVSGVGLRTVTSAKLRMQVSNASDLRGRIHTMTDCTWVENTVTWNTKPTFDAAVLNAPAGTAVVGNIVDFDITPALTGDGTKCFAIDNTSANGVQYKSREGAALRPQVILTVTP